MTTIVLNKDKLNNVGGVIRKIINSSSKLDVHLEALKGTLQGVNSNTYNLQDTMSSISSSSKTEEEKIGELKKLNTNVDTFINMAVSREKAARDKINKNKSNFYAKYTYLKPEKEKNFLESIAGCMGTVANWCVKHWRAIAMGFMVALSAVLLITGVGAILSLAYWGTILGAGIGGLFGGFMNLAKGKSFLEGFESGAFSGAVGGFLGGALAGGLAGVLGPGATAAVHIFKNIVIGALSTGISNMAVTAMDFYIEHGTLNGAMGDILVSGVIGILTGALLGGLFAKFSMPKSGGPKTAPESVAKPQEIQVKPKAELEGKGTGKSAIDNYYSKILEDPRYSHLKVDEIKSFNKYSINEFDNINNSFRVFEDGTPIETLRPENRIVVDNMKNALSRSKLPENMTLYRGCSPEELGQLSNLDLDDLVGRTFTEGAFTSTSVSNVRAGAFSEGMMFKINAPVGCEALDISGISGLSYEREILFNTGQEFLIKGAGKAVNPNNGEIITLLELDAII